MTRMFAYERKWLTISNKIADSINRVNGMPPNWIQIALLRSDMRQIEDRNKGFFRDLDTRYVPSSERPFK